jgi:prepilin-type N-terminal cleavage/methylation domain-containing protein
MLKQQPHLISSIPQKNLTRKEVATMKRFLKSFRRDQRGFTLIELLIVVAILGILAAVLLPNVTGFLKTGNLAAANTEVATVKTAAAAYYADSGDWPGDSATLYTGGYLDREPEAVYTFANGLITGVTDTGKWGGAGLTFDSSTQQWTK